MNLALKSLLVKSAHSKFALPWLCLGLGLLMLGAAPTHVAASTFTVDRSDDSATATACTAAANDCSLRGAVIASNNNAGADTIIVPAGTYTLTIPNTGGSATTTGEEAAATGDLDVTGPLTITGAGATTTFIQGGTTATNGIDKIFSFNPQGSNAAGFAVTMSGVTLQFGRNTVTGVAAGNDEGGAFDFDGGSSGSLTVNDCIITNNSTTNGGGGAFTLYEGGTVNINRTIISNNTVHTLGTALFVGGAIDVAPAGAPTAANLTLSNCSITGNSAPTENTQSQQGGAIFIRSGTGGSNTITHCTFSGNSAGSDGGAIYATNPVTIDNSTFSGNTSGRNGGAFFSSLTGTNTLKNLTIANNTATTTGGGIYNSSGTLVLTNSIVAANTGPSANIGGNNVDTTNSKFNLLDTAGGNGGLTNGTNSNLVGVAAGLDPGGLKDNGGTVTLPTGAHTFTIALVAGSPALDAGDPSVATGTTTDQRGGERVLDGPDADTTKRMDIGSLEQEPSIQIIGNQTTNEDTALPITFNVGDPTATAGLDSITATSSNTTLVPNLSANLTFTNTGTSAPTLTITPAANQFGTTNISVTVTDVIDGSSQSQSTTFTLTVNAVADTPNVTNASTAVNTQTTSGLVITRNAADGAEVTSFKITNITNGTLFQNNGTTQITSGSFISVAQGNAGLKFTPNNGTNAGSFQVQSSTSGNDTGLGGGVVTATITIIAAPTANSQSVNVAHNTATPITLTGSDPNTPAQPLTYTVLTNPTHGTLSGTAPNLTYTPNAGYQGTDSFTFRVNNGTSNSNTATVTINVAPGTPTANPQSVTTSFNTAKGITLTGSDPDTPALPLTYAIATSPTHGTLSGFNPSTGAVTYTPNANYQGADSFTFTASNGTNTSSAATVSITVNPGTPTANSQSVSTTVNTATPITLTGSDPDNPALPLTYIVTVNPTHGTLSGTAPNLTYTPNANYQGADSFQFTVSNGTNTSSGATVTINVLPPLGTSGALLSEFRLRGPNGATDEYVEIANTTTGTLNVSGWKIAYPNGVGGEVAVSIPNSTLIPVGGHLLFANSGGYSLGAYASPDITFTTDIPDTGGIELRNASNARVDAAGFASAAATYRQGTGINASITTNGEYAFMRKQTGTPYTNSGDNASDFDFVSVTGGTVSGTTTKLGAPGPKNLSSPLLHNDIIGGSVLPIFRDTTAVGTNATFGTMALRYKLTNNGTQTLTKLRFRAVQMPAGGAIAGSSYQTENGTADLRLLTSADTTATINGVSTPIKGSTLETPPNQPNGGALNSSMSLDLSGLPGGGLAPGASVNVQFVFGVVVKGTYRTVLNIEGLP